MKTKKNLIHQICTRENLWSAYQKTSKGKRSTNAYLEFNEYAAANLALICEELLDGAYVIGPYRHFTVREPKIRLISALDFRDRIVQHALCNVVAPIMETTLLPYTFACRDGMGTHAAVEHVQARLRKTDAKYFLKTDYSKFFPSVPRSLAMSLYDRKIGCQLTLAIIEEIIKRDGFGLPIGALTSQLTANLTGGIVDRYIHFDLGHRHWARYMDDIVILGDDLEKLREDFYKIEEFSALKMGMKISHWHAEPTSHGINFVGYRIWQTHKLLRKQSVIRAKRRIDSCIRHKDFEGLDKFLGSWLGHALWADSHNLLNWMEQKYELTTHYQQQGRS